jgi:hypothetical protein
VWDQRFYERVLTGGSLALGESYMDGWWNCNLLDQFFEKILGAELDKEIKKSSFLCRQFQVKSESIVADCVFKKRGKRGISQHSWVKKADNIRPTIIKDNTTSPAQR